ncbi:MAG: hypothetical protein IJD59_04510 [Clostridia bacterium]|nr:hypothetical protein [Clostridia bacterium]
MDFSFKSFVDGSFDYDRATKKHTSISLHREDVDIGRWKITIEDIDKLKAYPHAEVIRINGLCQDTFEYFISTYGKQLKAISFSNLKFVKDLSLLGTLPDLEYVHLFANQKVTALWDMSGNTSLTGLCIEDFTQLTSIKGIETAPALKEFDFGNTMWLTTVIDSLMPLSNTKIERLAYNGRAIADNDLSFLEALPNLKEFNFPTNILTTEQVAWIVANFPHVEGYALKAKLDFMNLDSNENKTLVPHAMIIGKRKPSLKVKGNEEKIQRYVDSFEKLKNKYKGVPYKVAFPS